MKTMGAAKFKANCLSVMSEVRAKREPVTVTKHGKPYVMMVPLDIDEEEDPLDRYYYPGKIVGDITEPFYTDAELAEFEAALLGSIE